MTGRIILSNGDLTASLDIYGQIQELFYPNTSAGNHAGTDGLHHKIGIYCDDAVHWLDDGTWKVQQTYYPGRLISRTIANNLWLGIRLEIQDLIDNDYDVMIRNIHIINLSNRARDIKLFMHQCFIIDDNSRTTNTSLYLPADSCGGLDVPAITHFYGDKAFVITGQSDKADQSFDEFSIGHFGKVDGNFMNGVWCDAADGKLSGNPSEQGNTDSITGFHLSMGAHDSEHINYYLSAAKSQQLACHNLQRILRDGAEIHIRKTAEHWFEWLLPAIDMVKKSVSPEARYDAIDAVVTLKASTSNHGAVTDFVFSSNNGNQPQVHPATSAAVASIFNQVGLDIDAGRIYDFFADIVERDKILYPSYLADGSIAQNSYCYQQYGDLVIPPICLADTTAMLYSLCRSIERSTTTKTIPAEWRKRWTRLGIPLADFLADYIDPITKQPLPTYHYGQTNSATTTTDIDILSVYSALMAAASIAEKLKDMASVIKYQAVADDIRDGASELWTDNVEHNETSQHNGNEISAESGLLPLVNSLRNLLSNNITSEVKNAV